MTRSILYFTALLSLLLGAAFAAPVAVSDAYSMNEDTVLSPTAGVFINDAFATDISGYTFAVDVFGQATGQNGPGTGVWSGTAGNPTGGLQVNQAFRTQVQAVRDPGFTKNYTLDMVQTVKVTFQYRMVTTGASAAAFTRVQSRPDSTGTVTIHNTLTGNGDTGWQTVTYTTASSLAAGARQLQIGIAVGNNSAAGAATVVYFDNVKVEPAVSNGVLANDTGGPTSAALVANVTHGSLVFNANGSFTYTPTANYNGPDAFTYTCTDGATTSNVGTVNITVTADADAPVGVTDSYSTLRNVTLTVPVGTGVLVNDTDVDTAAGSLTAVLFANAANGSVTLNANGSFSYVPGLNYFGADSFTYRVSDGALQSSNTTVNITVIGTSVPVGNADAYSMIRNSSLTVVPTTPQADVLEDVIPFGAVATPVLWKYLDNGTDQGTAWRNVGFNDAAWASGSSELGYGDVPADEATVVGFGPDPNNKYPTTYFRKVVTVTDLHRVKNVEISLIYDDGGIVYVNGTRVHATPSMTVNPAFNSLAPINSEQTTLTTSYTVPASALVEGANTIAVEIHQNTITSSDLTMNLRLRLTKAVYAGVLANDTDAENDPFTAALITNVTNGALTLNENGTFTYTPTAGYVGTDSFVYRAVDATGPSANTTATFTIIAGVNQAPIVVADTYNATEDTTLTVPVGTGVLANDSDGEGDTFTAAVVAAPTAAQGTLSLAANGSFVFTPTANFSGMATFTYRATDAQGAVSVTQTATIHVGAVNDTPVGVADTYSTDPGVTLNIPAAGVLANDTDADGDTLAAVLVSGLAPANSGTLTLNVDGSFSYAPAVGFSGDTTFVYRANDGTADSPDTTVTIRLNARPVANNDTYPATEDVPLTVSATGVLANDTDSENDPLTAILVVAPIPAQGSVTLNANGSFTFTPAANFNGAATFTYKANDTGRDSLANATVTINVAPVNDAPSGVTDSYVTPVSTPLTVFAVSGVLANDTDLEGNTLTAAVVAQPTHGTLGLNPDGAFYYAPTTGYIGPDSFTYRANDGSLNSAVTTVSLQVGINPSDVKINEIMYHPSTNNDLEEYIELYNSGVGPMALAGWKFDKGVDFTFPAVTLPAGGYLVVAANVASFNAAYGSVPLIVGGWAGTLANAGQTVRLQYPNSTATDGFSEVDSVSYSKEGDWGLRRAFASSGESGWEWETRADGFGDSLQLINPLISNNNGQNWTRREVLAAGNQRTPGAVNTDLAANPTLNSAPLISSVKHRPQIPSPTQPVNVTAKLADELTTGITGKVLYRTWTPSQSTAGGNYTEVAMLDDGLHGDGAANDGEFGATLPVQTLNTIVEFYIQATDSGARSRTWPAPTTTAGAQGANCLYQVDTEVWTNRQPIYRLIATGLDEYEFAPSRWAQLSDAAINVTFISTQGDDIDVHYQSSIRVRGAGSRGNIPRNWKVEWVADDQFNGQRGGNLNVAFPYIQYLGAQLMKQANLPHEGSIPVQVRLNHTNNATNTDRYGYGMYVHMQPIGENTYVDENFSSDPSGNIYKKVRPHQAFTVRSVAGGGPLIGTLSPVAGYVGDGWSKQSNTSANNWNDLHGWMQVITSGYTEATLAPVMDIEQWCRALAMTTILSDNETNLSNGANDDYGFYFGVTDPRAKLLIHDYDTILAGGDSTTTATGSGIYHMTDATFGGSETLTAMTNFYSDPQINQRYKAQLFDLLNTVFLPANFNATVDAQLADWVSPIGSLPSTLRDGYKAFIAARRTHILGIINGTFSATTNLTVTNGFPTTTVATTTGLSGTVNSVTTRKVTVNDAPVTLDNYNAGASGSGTWTAGSLVTLKPGINQVTVRALGTGDVVLSSQTFDIVYDDASITDVSAISGNTVWTVAGGPYLITSTITVDDETLSIEPGTTVYVAPGMRINVSGTGRILAEGTAALPIRFSKQPSAAGTWNGIFIDEATQESRFSHVIFADNGTTAISAQTGSRVVVDSVTFRNTSQPFLSLNDSSFVISNTTFPDSTAAFPPVSGSGVPVGGEAIVTDCVFGKTLGANASVTFSNMKRPGPILQLLRNTFNGSQADLVQLNGCDGWLEGNTFLHAHKNSSTVKASAISGGAFLTLKSNVTIIRNLIYDCDHAITMREGNAAAVVQNTIAHITHTGGTDTASGVFNFADDAETPGSGLIAEANIIWDAAALTRTYNSALTLLNLDNNILPIAWAGSGTDNIVADPMLNLASIITPETATAAQIAAAFVADVNSPAIGTGVLGVADRGALIPAGVLVGGAPVSPTPLTNALLMFGPNGGFGTFAAYGYTHYQAAVDGGAYGAITPISTSLTLSSLATGAHTVSVLGKNDAGIWQTAPTVVSWTVNPAAITVRINEVLANNVNAYPVGTTRPDMIELHNYGSLAVNLGGCSVSDNPDLPTKFIVPANTIIPAGGYLVLLGDVTNANPGIHIGFGLDADGDSFALYPPGAVVGATPVDSVTFGLQIPDLSIARTGLAKTWALATVSPLAANTAVALGSNTALKINEWCGSNDFIIGSDFVELYNPGTRPVAIGGMFLSSDIQVAAEHTIAPLSYIAASGFVRFVADADPTAGSNHLTWSLSKLREVMRLITSGGVTIDTIASGPQRADQSEGRATDGSTTLAFFTLPTPGYSNNTVLTTQQDLLDFLRITELMYNPSGGTSAPEFIELKNTSTTLTLNIGGIKFTNGIDYTFPANTMLTSGQFLILTSNPSAFTAAYGFAAFNSTPYSGKLADGGERVRIEIGDFQLGILDFSYSSSWHPTANGTGASIEIISPLADRSTWDVKESWRVTAPNPGLQGVFGVVAGDDFSVSLPATASLTGVVSYGSQVQANVALAWTKDNGPGTVAFSAPTALTTTASFSLPGNYVLRLTATGTTTVFDTLFVYVDEDYTNWATRTIGSNPATNGLLNDADNDGLKNILEYAFGTSPNVATPALLTGFNSGDLFAVSFTRSSTANVTFAIEVADSINGPWTSDTIVTNLQSDNGILQTWVGYDTRPITANTQRYIRARVIAN